MLSSVCQRIARTKNSSCRHCLGRIGAHITRIRSCFRTEDRTGGTSMSAFCNEISRTPGWIYSTGV